MAHGCDCEVFFDEIIEECRDPQDPSPSNRVLCNDEAHSHITGMSEQSASDRLRGTQSQLSSLKASVLSLQEKTLANDAIVDCKLTSIQQGVYRLNDSPERRIRGSGTAYSVDTMLLQCVDDMILLKPRIDVIHMPGSFCW